MDEVFGDENSVIDDDHFMEDDPDHGFGDEESGSRSKNKKNSKKSKTMQAKDQFSDDQSYESRNGRSPKSKKGQSMMTNQTLLSNSPEKKPASGGFLCFGKKP
jgi:hypothetical protein